MQDMIEIIPEPIRNMFDGGDNLGSIAASASTANQDAIAGIADALGSNDAQQQIALSFELDGREVDKKILNVVGGVVQPLIT